MSNEQEKMLSSLKVDYDAIKIPEGIDDFIKKGMTKYPKKNKIYKYVRLTSTAAVMALLMLSFSVRLSPVFAGYLEDVPILKYIVKLVNYDKGLKSAVENDFIQNVSISDEHEGIKVTVDSIIVDQARMIVFYTIQNNSNYKYLQLAGTKFTDTTGKDIEAAYDYSSFNHKDITTIQDRINVSFTESTVIPEVIHLSLKLGSKVTADTYEAAELPYVWQFDIPIDKSRFENLKEIYDINQTVEVEDQKLIFKKAVVYPTRIELQIELPSENSKKILSFDDLKILNEKGDSLTAITNDVVATRSDDNHISLFFESNYFERPQSMFIQGSSIRAVDKDKLDIIVDTDSKQLLKAPDSRIKLDDVVSTSEGTEISFLLNSDEKLDKDFIYFIFTSKAVDANGEKYDVIKGASNGCLEPGFNKEVLLTIPKGSSCKNPIKLTIEDYPARITGGFKLQIK